MILPTKSLDSYCVWSQSYQYVFVVYEWNKHEGVLNTAVPVIWERIGRQVNKVWQVPKAVIHVDAYLDPEDITFRAANESKVSFLFTGSKVGSLLVKIHKTHIYQTDPH